MGQPGRGIRAELANICQPLTGGGGASKRNRAARLVLNERARALRNASKSSRRSYGCCNGRAGLGFARLGEVGKHLEAVPDIHHQQERRIGLVTGSART